MHLLRAFRALFRPYFIVIMHILILLLLRFGYKNDNLFVLHVNVKKC